MSCALHEENSARLDLYIDGQMDPAESAEMARHLSACPECEALRLNRVSLRDRVRKAARDVEIPFGMGDRIHFAIAKQGRSGSQPTRILLALAAALVLSAGGYYYYPELVPRAPLPVASNASGDNETYISQVTALVPPVMRIGLAQHVHCAVQRQYPATPPSLLEIAHSAGANPGLINAVESHLPDQCRVVMAHQCSYKGRNYIHVIARGGGHLLSLLITKRGDENLGADLQSVATELDAPIYAAGIQSFSIDSFQTQGDLVYLISDFDPTQNLNMLQGMTAEVRAALL
jgi:anti-sigma factor RsiW